MVKKLHICGLAVFKSPTRACDFVYNNAYNLHKEGNFEGNTESFWASCRFRIKYTNKVTLKLRMGKASDLLI